MAIYFSLLARNGDLADVFSQLRFLERESTERSFEWIVAVSAMKSAVNRICDIVYGYDLFT